MPTPLHANASVLTRAETDVLYGVAMDRAVMAYKGTETRVLYGVEMAWRADATECYRSR
jgi:hypothetical protein